MIELTPHMIAAAWQAWHERHKGKIGPGPGFVEAIRAALALIDLDKIRQDAYDQGYARGKRDADDLIDGCMT